MNDSSLLRFDTVAHSHRSLVAECERQQNRLIQLLHWYDHQQVTRGLTLHRQAEKMSQDARRQINMRSKIATRERARLQHLLDDNVNDIDSLNTSKSFSSSSSSSSSQPHDPSEDRKRRIYKCLLPQFKAPLSRSMENWSQPKSPLTRSHTEYKDIHQPLERYPLKKLILSPVEQRKRMNRILDKCEREFEQCDGHGYEHSLSRTEVNRHTQILAQQQQQQQ